MRLNSIVTSVGSKARGKRGYVMAAIAGAALFGGGAMQSAFAGTYGYVFTGTGTTNDWTNTAAWTLTSGTASSTNYPGGDATEVDDAVISYIATVTGGVNNITLSAPLANSLGNLSIIMQDTTSTDQINFAVNANLTINGSATLTGGSTGSSNRGLVTMTTGNGTNLVVNGTMTLASANGNGSVNTLGYSFVTINGNATLGGLTIKNDADKFVVSASAGTVNLGNVSLNRTLANATAASAGGLHLLGGTVTANNFLIGSGDSSADVEVNGANLTINGSFIVGDNSAASARLSSVFQTLGNVSAANSTLFLGSSALGTVGVYQLGNGTNNVSLTVAGMQLTNVGGSANNKANFTMANGTLLNVGSSGIGTGSGTYTFTNNGGAIVATGSFSSTANMAITNTVTLQAADGAATPFDITWSGAISGAGNITKTGGGNLTLSGANTYTGPTTVSAGTLIVNNTAAGSSGTGTGAVSITNASLAGTGTISGDVTVSTGSHIAPGVNSVGTLNFGGNLAISSGAVLDFDFNTSANSLINVTNAAKTLTIGTNGIDLYAEGTTNAWQTNGTYTLFQVAGTVPSIAGLSILNGVSGVTYTLGSTAHAITVTISGGLGAVGWAHDANGSWGTSSNWNGGVPSGSVAILGNVLTAPRTVTLDGDRSVTGINLNSAFGYTVAQGTGGNLTLDNGASTATINDFAGPHVISAPVILNSPTAVMTTNPTDTLTISGVLGGTGNMTVSGPGTVILTNSANTLTGAINNTGNLQVGSGAATGSLGAGTVVNTGVLSFNSSSNMAISTTISGSGNVVQNGTGVVTLSGANTYSGATVINNGIVRYGTTTGLAAGNVNVQSPGKLDLNGLAVTMTTLTGTGIVDNMLAASNSTLTFNGSNPTFNGSIQSTGGNLSVVSAVSGRLTLGGASTYAGGTSVTTGLLQVNSSNALGTGNVTLTSTTANTLQLGSGVVLPNAISLNDGAIEFTDVATGGTSATFAGPISTVGSTQYRLGNSNATSTLIMTGASTVGSGITLLTRGNIIFQGNGSLNVSNNSVTIGRSGATATVVVTIQDNAVVRGVGVNLGGLNSTSDDLSSNVTISGNGLLDAGTGVFSLNNSNFTGNSTTSSSVILETDGNSTVRGSAFTVTGASTHTSTTWLATGGSIVATANNANFMPASSVLKFQLAGEITINDGGFNIGIAQPFLADFGGGNIDKTGTGSLSMSAANNAYGGTTNVLAGSLFSNAVGATSTGSVVVSAGATVGGTGSILGAVTVSGHLAPGAGATVGTLTLSGGLTMNSGSTLDMNFLSDGSANSQLALSSGSLSGLAGLDLYIAGTTNPFAVNGTYTLGTFADPSFTAASVLNSVAGVTYTFANNAGSEVLTISGGITSAVWAADADGAWGTSGSWTGGVPNQVGAIATFGGVITAPRTVTISGSQTVGQINFNNANAYTVTGGTIVLDNGTSGPALVTDTLGNHTIASAVTLNSNTTVNVATATNVLTMSGPISGSGGLTKTGPGALVISGTYNTTAPTLLTAGSLTLSAGSNTSGLISGAGNLTVSGGTKAAPGLTVGGVQTNGLTIAGALKIASGSATSKVSAYSLAGATGAWTGSLDLNGNKFVVEDAVTKATTIATLQNQVAFGTTSAFGISSSGLAANYGIAVLDNNVTKKTTFGGLAVDANSVLVAPELLGDANADGTVNQADLTTVLNNFGSATAAWTSGNFDGLSTIDLTDLADVLNNFGLTNPNAAADVSGTGGGAVPTPEPGTLAVIAAGAAAVMAKRRRRGGAR